MEKFFACDPILERMVLCCFVPANTGANTLRERPSHGIALFLGSRGAVRFADGTRLALQGPSVVYFPQHSSYTITEETPADWYAVNFLTAREITAPPFAVSVSQRESWQALFADSVRSWNNRQPGRRFKARSILYEILYRLRLAGATETADPIGPALSYIHSHYLTQSIFVDDLAALCGISAVYLRRLFVARFGMSPARYVRNLKLQKAEELLLSGLYTASQVCQMSGFADESHFSRVFKQRYGQPPKAFSLSVGPHQKGPLAER